jgi:hypothetical protein
MTLPLISCSSLLGQDRQKSIEQLVAGFKRYGVIQICDHGIEKSILQNYCNMVKSILSKSSENCCGRNCEITTATPSTHSGVCKPSKVEDIYEALDDISYVLMEALSLHKSVIISEESDNHYSTKVFILLITSGSIRLESREEVQLNPIYIDPQCITVFIGKGISFTESEPTGPQFTNLFAETTKQYGLRLDSFSGKSSTLSAFEIEKASSVILEGCSNVGLV